MWLWLLFVCRAPADPCPAATVADGFDFPVGAPDAVGYYDAQPFGRNHHLGHDWNGEGRGNSDLGDPVHAVADGVVTEATDVGGGWGRVLRVAHRTDAACVESLYAHLDRFDVAVGDTVRRGAVVGSIGDAHGVYVAHLHFELRDRVGAPLGGGYGRPGGHVDATAFIAANRPER